MIAIIFSQSCSRNVFISHKIKSLDTFLSELTDARLNILPCLVLHIEMVVLAISPITEHCRSKTNAVKNELLVTKRSTRK